VRTLNIDPYKTWVSQITKHVYHYSNEHGIGIMNNKTWHAK